MKSLIKVMVVICIANVGQLFAEECIVGQKRPSGGYIFYCDNPNNKKLPAGKIGLETAPKDQIQGILWSNEENVTTGAVKAAVGTGLWNTKKIIQNQGTNKDKVSSAAMLCYSRNDVKNKNRDIDGDWYLPSKEELNLMYKNIAAKDTRGGGFASTFYWSSSESYNTSAWNQNFFDGKQGQDSKISNNVVRCVRAF